MKSNDLDLTSYAQVSENAILIYQCLESGRMPLMGEPWPPEPIETFRLWVNEGCRRTRDDPVNESQRIPPPHEKKWPLFERRDLRSLSQYELDNYRMRVDARFDVANANPDAPGQIFFGIHGGWCLHYQEAFLLWHRAYLMRFEQEIGCAVPYWNWYAEGASQFGNLAAGLPAAFTDETYIHPKTREKRPNPLRFAAARNGRSKGCASNEIVSPDCKWVQRNSQSETCEQIHLTLKYQQQVFSALKFKDFSHPQGSGNPWADIQSFLPPPPDTEYIYRNFNFDGAYEQPHDNYHGWIGPDMADNSYAAFDPIFWSFHANIDRIFELWLRAHPAATYTAGFPLHPFSGPRADAVEFVDSRSYVYTTIGDMAKDCRSLGYDFAPPVGPDFNGTEFDNGLAAAPEQTAPAGLADVESKVEWIVVFDGVACTHESYTIDVFLNQPKVSSADIAIDNKHYVGRLTRIGMGQADERSRCIEKGVRRILDATATVVGLGISSNATAPSLSYLATDLSSGKILSAEECAALPGFVPRLVRAVNGLIPRNPTP